MDTNCSFYNVKAYSSKPLGQRLLKLLIPTFAGSPPALLCAQVVQEGLNTTR